MEIVIPTELFWILIVIIGGIAYTIFGAIVAGIDYRYSNNVGYDEPFALIPVLLMWPICLAFILIWWTIFLPARMVFNKLSGKKG